MPAQTSGGLTPYGGNFTISLARAFLKAVDLGEEQAQNVFRLSPRVRTTDVTMGSCCACTPPSRPSCRGHAQLAMYELSPNTSFWKNKVHVRLYNHSKLQRDKHFSSELILEKWYFGRAPTMVGFWCTTVLLRTQWKSTNAIKVDWRSTNESRAREPRRLYTHAFTSTSCTTEAWHLYSNKPTPCAIAWQSPFRSIHRIYMNVEKYSAWKQRPTYLKLVEEQIAQADNGITLIGRLMLHL